MDTRIYNDLAVYGSIVFANNISEFPENPRVGEMVLLNGRHYAWTQLSANYFTWLPITVKQSAYVHTQAVPSTTWTINHNLGTFDYGIFVYDTDHNLIMVNHAPVNGNTVQVDLVAATAGTAVVFAVTDFSATNFSSSTIQIGTLELTDVNGVLNVNGSPVGGTPAAGAVTVPYDVAASIFGQPTASEVAIRFRAPRAYTLIANQTNAQARAGTAATASTVFTIAKNGTQVGTITFSAGSAVGTFSFASAVTMAVGDVLTVTAPGSADATLADVDFSLVATATNI